MDNDKIYDNLDINEDIDKLKFKKDEIAFYGTAGLIGLAIWSKIQDETDLDNPVEAKNLCKLARYTMAMTNSCSIGMGNNKLARYMGIHAACIELYKLIKDKNMDFELPDGRKIDLNEELRKLGAAIEQDKDYRKFAKKILKEE